MRRYTKYWIALAAAVAVVAGTLWLGKLSAEGDRLFAQRMLCDPAGDLCIRACHNAGSVMVCSAELAKTLLDRPRIGLSCACGDAPVVRELEQNRWTHGAHPALTHTFALIECTRDCAAAETAPAFWTSETRVRAALAAPVARRRAPPRPFPVCALTAVLRGRPPLLDVWLMHQRELGVGAVFAYVDPDAFEPTELYTLYRRAGRIVEIPWPRIHGPRAVYGRSQHLAYADALYRFRGWCEWTMFADVDDFFAFWDVEGARESAASYLGRVRKNVTTVSVKWIDVDPHCGAVRADADGLPPPLSLFRVQLDTHNTKHATRTDFYHDALVHSAALPSAAPVPEVQGVAYHWRMRAPAPPCTNRSAAWPAGD